MQSNSVTGFSPFPPAMGRKSSHSERGPSRNAPFEIENLLQCPACKTFVFAKLNQKLFLCKCPWNVYLQNVLPEFMVLPLFFLYMTTSLSSLEAAQDFGFANFIVAMKTFWRLMSLKRASSHLHISVLHYRVTKYFLQTNFLYPWKAASRW